VEAEKFFVALLPTQIKSPPGLGRELLPELLEGDEPSQSTNFMTKNLSKIRLKITEV
jgi:hypothetical protein